MGFAGFTDRHDAGCRLAELLRARALHRPLVVALPRGGVPVAAPIAAALTAPLEVLVVRKIGLPGREEFGVGALAEGGEPVYDDATLARLGLSCEDLAEVVARERAELERRSRVYRGGRLLPDLPGRDVVLVDDGLATGGTARAALRALRALGPRSLVLAVPVAAPGAPQRLRAEADDVVCVAEPAGFMAVGQYYRDFDQTTDAEVLDILAAG